MEARAFHNLVSETISYHFCYVLSVTQTRPGAAWEGTAHRCEHREAGILGGHFGEWLPHRGSCHDYSPNLHVLNVTFKKQRAKLRVQNLRDGVPKQWDVCLPTPPEPKTHSTRDKNFVVILRRKEVYLKAAG